MAVGNRWGGGGRVGGGEVHVRECGMVWWAGWVCDWCLRWRCVVWKGRVGKRLSGSEGGVWDTDVGRVVPYVEGSVSVSGCVVVGVVCGG
jgi:hypothetical protein